MTGNTNIALIINLCISNSKILKKEDFPYKNIMCFTLLPIDVD